jgi:endonuclease III
MPEPAVSAQKTFSRFFEPQKKRPRDAVEAEEEQDTSASASRAFSSGTASDPLILEESCDDDSISEETSELPPSERCKSPTESEPEEVTDVSKIPDAINVQPTTSSDENPFACFAHKSSETSPRTTNPLKWRIVNRAVSDDKQAQRAKKKKSSSKKTESFTSVNELSADEKLRITKKWHSMADKSAPLEVRRFQVLVAARLHARCQEPTVRKAMKSLRDNLDDFTAESVAKVDPEILALCITNLQFYNAKAKQIVKAANEIMSQFNGQVPEDVNCLLQITGVGKVFADLLSYVNTRKAHAETEIEDSAV